MRNMNGIVSLLPSSVLFPNFFLARALTVSSVVRRQGAFDSLVLGSSYAYLWCYNRRPKGEQGQQAKTHVAQESIIILTSNNTRYVYLWCYFVCASWRQVACSGGEYHFYPVWTLVCSVCFLPLGCSSISYDHSGEICFLFPSLSIVLQSEVEKERTDVAELSKTGWRLEGSNSRPSASMHRCKADALPLS
jgi:hypothetical protein